jgi:7-cyano-7-deazaguanine synthase in queuosine biosynthesis
MNKIDFQKEVVLLSVVDLDNPYGYKETVRMRQLYNIEPSSIEKTGDGVEIKFVTLKGYGRLANTDTHVVLGRNAVIASIASSLSNDIWIMGTRFEKNSMMYDKNKPFWYAMSEALSRACGYERIVFDEGGLPYTRVYSPFQGTIWDLKFLNWDKDSMIVWLEQHGYLQWRDTISCFHPVLARCGECAVCGKRFVYEAYVGLSHGITVSEFSLLVTYTSNPLKNKHLLKTLQAMKQAERNLTYSRYSKDRIDIYKLVANIYGLNSSTTQEVS